MPRAPYDRVSNKGVQRSGRHMENQRNSYDYSTFSYQRPPGYDVNAGDLPQYPLAWFPDKGDHEFAKRQKVIDDLYPNRIVHQTIDENVIRMAEKKNAELEGLQLQDFIEQNVDWSNGLLVQHMAEKGLLDRFERQDAAFNMTIDMAKRLYKIIKYGPVQMDRDDWSLVKQIVGGEIQLPPMVQELIQPRDGTNVKSADFQRGLLNPYRFSKWLTLQQKTGNNILRQMFVAGNNRPNPTALQDWQPLSAGGAPGVINIAAQPARQGQ